MILTFSPSELSVKSGHTNTIVVKADTRADTWSALSIPSWATVKENRDNSCTITLSPPVGTKADTYQMRIWAEDSLSDDRAVGVMKVRAGDLDDEPITPDQLDAAAKAIKSYVDKVFAARANLRLTRPHTITLEITERWVMPDKYFYPAKLRHQSINFSISDNDDNDVYPVILSGPDWAWIEGDKLYLAPPVSAAQRLSYNKSNYLYWLNSATSIKLGLSNGSSSGTVTIYALAGPIYLSLNGSPAQTLIESRSYTYKKYRCTYKTTAGDVTYTYVWSYYSGTSSYIWEKVPAPGTCIVIQNSDGWRFYTSATIPNASFQSNIPFSILPEQNIL